MEMKEMIEQATPKERKQLRAYINYSLNSLRKRRKKSLEPEGELEDGHRNSSIR